MLLVLHEEYGFETHYQGQLVIIITIISQKNIDKSRCLLVIDVIKTTDIGITYRVLYEGKIKRFTLYRHTTELMSTYV